MNGSKNHILSFQENNSQTNNHNTKKNNFFQSIKNRININFILILILLVIPIKSKESGKINNNNNYSYITLVINGIGKKNVFHPRNANDICKKFDNPDEVFINGINQSIVNYEYNFNESKNFVKLIWNKKVNYTICLFSQCRDIYEIDLTHFDSSSIKGEITGMFHNCLSLISLDLSNFNLSQVTKILNLFLNCKS